MSLLNYSTKISAEQTISEIQKILVKYGAHKITTDYKDGVICAVTFCITLNDRIVGYSLPANHEGVLKVMRNDRNVRSRGLCTEEQAKKVAWRIVKDWVEAQMAIVELQLAELPEVFLPYAITDNGQTVFQRMKSNPQLLLNP